MDELIYNIENELLSNIKIESESPYDPVVVKYMPKDWKLIGCGNYAVVVYNNSYPKYAVKIYADGRPGIEDEKIVYKKLGENKGFSKCYCYGKNYLILKRLEGVTLYDCLKKGIEITKEAVDDIDCAIKYAKTRGLNPHDIHFKNVMIRNGTGMIVDVSDFLKKGECFLWRDCKKFYYKVYIKVPFVVPIPEFILNGCRKLYRVYKRYIRKKYK